MTPVPLILLSKKEKKINNHNDEKTKQNEKKRQIQDFTLTGSFRQKNTAVTCVKKISICFDNSVI